jgi:hypothetical protein
LSLAPDGGPIDGLEEGLDVVGPLEPVVDHVGVLEDVHDQERRASGRVADVMLVDPEVDQPAVGQVLVEDDPADAAHGPRRPEVLLPGFDVAELLDDPPAELAGGIERGLAAEVLEVELVEPHSVELPAEAALELGVFGGRRLAVLGHEAQDVEDLVRVGHVALIEREMVLQERFAEAGQADELGVILGGIVHVPSLL